MSRLIVSARRITKEAKTRMEGQNYVLASPTACRRCGKGANLDLVLKLAGPRRTAQVSVQGRGCLISPEGWSRAIGW